MPTLDYAVPLPWFRRRKFRRFAVGAFFLVAILITFWVGRTLWHKVRLRHYEQQVSNLRLSPTQIVYDDSPSASIPVGTDAKDYRRQSFPAGRRAVIYDPQCLIDYLAFKGAHKDPGALIYAYRGSPGGAEEILTLRFNGYQKEREYTMIMFGGEIVGISDTPGEINSGNLLYAPSVMGKPKMSPLRIFAAEPDATDPRRFTIRYEVDSEPGLISGQFTGTGLKIEIVTGPLKAPNIPR
jgi:hypothetical protein